MHGSLCAAAEHGTRLEGCRTHGVLGGIGAGQRRAQMSLQDVGGKSYNFV